MAPKRLLAAAQHVEGPPCVAEYSRHCGGAAWSALARRDHDPDFLQRRQAWAQAVDHRRREGGQRARAGERDAVRGPCLGVVLLAESGHECAGIREIEIVRGCSERGAGDPVSLALERPGAVDDQAGAQRAQVMLETGGSDIETSSGAAASGDDFDPGIRLQGAADTRPEISRCPDHDCPHGAG